jgi:UDP-N-acetylmuramoyl-L-alanyl-D-glutamate--2,6-diaminopimelate ligase
MRPRSRPARTLGDLAHAFGLADAGPATVAGIAVGSADVQQGDLFVALRGAHAHGADHTPEAVAAGAVAVLTDADGRERVRRAGIDVPVLVCADPRALVGEVSAWLYDNPARELTVVGVTGTNGKTTTCYFVDAALHAVHATTGIVGTVELRVGAEAIESPRTTVEAPVLHGLFALMAERGATACAMEVSSHALALDRVGGVRFDVVGFTNLQRDHLDFHGDMAGYFRDKARLFTPDRAQRAVICVDDEWGLRLADEVQIPFDTVATRDDSPGAARADWRVTDATIGLDGVGSTFTLVGPDGTTTPAASPLPGLVNVSNAAMAVVLAHRAGVPLDDAAAAVGAAAQIPGRMERVVERAPGLPLCLVDYAHTPDALTLALQAVRPITPGRLIIVFGSDGDRDRGKRPIMGRIAAELADVLLVTDENPRSEEPGTIRTAILDGARAARPDGRNIHEVQPRAHAVRVALELAGEGDTVIVTGKGHEPTQEIAGVFHRYNDRDAFLAAVEARCRITERPDGVTVLDATGAATPPSVRFALRQLAQRAAGRRTIAVIGAMNDLGRVDVSELDAVGRLAVRLGIDKLLVIGDEVRGVHTGARQEGSFDGESRLVTDPPSALAWLEGELAPGDVVLVKGSAEAGLGRLATALSQGGNR